jgi:hypothetical protein
MKVYNEVIFIYCTEAMEKKSYGWIPTHLYRRFPRAGMLPPYTALPLCPSSHYVHTNIGTYTLH